MSSFRRKKDSFYVIMKRKYSIHRDLNPRSMDLYGAKSLPLSYLTCWWMGIKLAYQVKINSVYTIVTKLQIVHNFEQMLCKKAATLTFISYHRSIQCTQLSQNCKLCTISNKMLCKNSSNILNTISYHRCLFDKKWDKNVTTLESCVF